MAKICMTRRVPGDCERILRDSPHDLWVNVEDRPLSREELLDAVAGSAGVMTQLTDKVDAAFFDAAGGQLRVVANYAVGYNNIDLEEATRRGIVVTNTPDVLSDATADIGWTLLLGVARRVIEGDRLTRSGDWQGWAPHLLLGADLVGRTLAVVGAGRIGYAMAKRARGWDMRILYVSREAKPVWERELEAERMELDAALAEADFVSLHVPLTERTHHLIGEQRLATMKPTAYLINTSRGAVVDERALVEALRRGTIAGAGLDVYEHEPALVPGLADCPNAVLLPHLGSATVETRATMGRLAADNLLAALDGRRPPHPVNPAVCEHLAPAQGNA